MADETRHVPSFEHPVRPVEAWAVVSAAIEKRAADVGHPLQVVDLGGGVGGLAVRIAKLGHRVTVVDPSPNALASLQRWVAEAGVADQVVSLQGDSESLAELVEPRRDNALRILRDRSRRHAASARPGFPDAVRPCRR